MSKVQFEIEIPSYLLGTPREKHIRAALTRQTLEQTVLELYQQREISTGTGARMLGLPLHDFIQWLGQHEVSLFEFTAEEWQQELNTLHEISARLKLEQEARAE
jgi:predicted HTH domain antitoxin